MAYNKLGTSGKLKNPDIEEILLDPCYFGLISRNEAEDYLKERGELEGTFLVRKGIEGYKLSVLAWEDGDCCIHHYVIEQDGKQNYFIDKQFTFGTVVDLISYYKQKCTNMPQRLTVPCPLEDIQEDPTFPIVTQQFKINREDVTVISQLAGGNYSEVWKGLLSTFTNEVAIKTQACEEVSSEYLLQEAAILEKLQHNNIVRFLGIVEDYPVYVILELQNGSDLLNYLLHNDTYEIPSRDRIVLAQEIASALEYVSSNNIAHRNVSAANVLLDDDFSCKLGGFGFAVSLDENGVYTANKGDKQFRPNIVRWMALEAATCHRFSVSSDVWSFACLLVELFTNGEAPFSNLLTPQVIPQMKMGFRPPKPSALPESLYSLMLRCWCPDSNMRPTFPEIQNEVKMILQSFGKDSTKFVKIDVK